MVRVTRTSRARRTSELSDVSVGPNYWIYPWVRPVGSIRGSDYQIYPWAMAAGSGLEKFHRSVQAWFRGTFTEPTTAQVKGWAAIARGDSTLLLAPTGSGKTLAAFLWCLDRLMFQPEPASKARCRVLYVSPLKALAVDVERNLRAPIAGIAEAAARLGDWHRVPSRARAHGRHARRASAPASSANRPTSSSRHPSRCT